MQGHSAWLVAFVLRKVPVSRRARDPGSSHGSHEKKEKPMPQPSTMSSIDVARAQLVAYNEKNWQAARAILSPVFVYDEVGTHRKAQGRDESIEMWQAWAKALPDSNATITNEIASGSTVVLELIWRGTQSGPMNLEGRQIPPSGKKIEMRACQLIEVDGDKAKSLRHYFDIGTMLRQLGIA
jgi:steroid delta-isomerase-like uncharacterized protein